MVLLFVVFQGGAGLGSGRPARSWPRRAGIRGSAWIRHLCITGILLLVYLASGLDPRCPAALKSPYIWSCRAGLALIGIGAAAAFIWRQARSRRRGRGRFLRTGRCLQRDRRPAPASRNQAGRGASSEQGAAHRQSAGLPSDRRFRQRQDQHHDSLRPGTRSCWPARSTRTATSCPRAPPTCGSRAAPSSSKPAASCWPIRRAVEPRSSADSRAGSCAGGRQGRAGAARRGGLLRCRNLHPGRRRRSAGCRRAHAAGPAGRNLARHGHQSAGLRAVHQDGPRCRSSPSSCATCPTKKPPRCWASPCP